MFTRNAITLFNFSKTSQSGLNTDFYSEPSLFFLATDPFLRRGEVELKQLQQCAILYCPSLSPIRCRELE